MTFKLDIYFFKCLNKRVFFRKDHLMNKKFFENAYYYYFYFGDNK